MSNKIILYDLNSDAIPKQWSPNTLKTRLLLNYLQLPFETEWLPFPDIAPFLQRAGVPPHKVPQEAHISHTVPTINDNGVWVMDSLKILDYLQVKYNVPRNRVIPDEEFWHAFKVSDAQFGKIGLKLGISFTELYLEEGSSEAYAVAKQKPVGGELSLYREDHKTVNDTWTNLVGELNSLSLLRNAIGKSDSLSESKLFQNGFLYGDSISYADFVLYARLYWIQLSIQYGSLDHVEGITKDNWMNPTIRQWFDRISVYNK